MKKRIYRAIWIKDVDATSLQAALQGQYSTVAIDVAKKSFFAAFQDESGEVQLTVKWLHPEQSPAFMSLVVGLAAAGCNPSAVMEPSGVYGDALRYHCEQAGITVYRVSPQRTHNAAIVYDGVRSWHDAKSAAIIGKLHFDRTSELWPIKSDHLRRLKAALLVKEIHDLELRRNCTRLEGHLARYWPGGTADFAYDSAALLELLAEYGGPAPVAKAPIEAADLLRRVGTHFLKQEKIDALIRSASITYGMPQLDEELYLVRVIAAEARRHQKLSNQARARVQALTKHDPATDAMAATIGQVSAAALIVGVGDATEYSSAAAYRKALGLNLKEKSSGTQHGALHITKNGPGLARLYLYMAVLRLVQRDQIVRAWYLKKVKRDGGRKLKALVAVMRKLASALWHVAQGKRFDSSKLFDVSRLQVEVAAQGASR
jgi:transposase